MASPEVHARKLTGLHSHWKPTQNRWKASMSDFGCMMLSSQSATADRLGIFWYTLALWYLQFKLCKARIQVLTYQLYP